jgi:hypothetical protein
MAKLVHSLALRLAKQGGAMIVIDYGYHDHHAGDTLQAVHAHAYADPFVNGIVSTVNDTPIRKLEDIKTAFLSNTNTHHVLTFEGIEGSLVLDARLARQSQNAICEQYGIARTEWMGATP